MSDHDEIQQDDAKEDLTIEQAGNEEWQQYQEDVRHAEELATKALNHLELRASLGATSTVFSDEVAALRFLTGIPRERK